MAGVSVAHKPQEILLEGARLSLRTFGPGDISEAYLAWLQDANVIRYLECRFSPVSMESLRSYVTAKLSDPNHHLFAVILKNGNRHIGNIKLGPIDGNHKFGEVGVIIGEKDCWGKGYAAEAIRLLSAHAFQTLGLNKLIAGTYDVNRASIQAFQKAGFFIEGRRERQYLFEGRYVDVVLMALFNPAVREHSDAKPG